MTYKIGSLFDGSGGFPLAASLCGIEPTWASEVEPYPIAVTRSRFPNMKHLGDISKINGAEVEPVDVITFGSPCQDLSVAGKRAGLKHEAKGDEETTRSGLFMEAVRIIKEMRKATNGKYPSFALWENVPGAFSSNKGEDFRIVCEELIKIVEPKAVMPAVPQGGWPYADSYCGDGWSLAYRVFDAQYWGVPQRRRRIHLVVDFRGERAREVLFEREGVRGYFAEGRTPWQAAAGNAQDRAGADDRAGGCIGFDVYNMAATGDVTKTLTAIKSDADHVPVACYAVGTDIYNLAVTGDVACSLTAGGNTSTGTAPKVIIPCYAVDQGGGGRGLDAVGVDSYNLCTTGDVARTVTTPSGGLNEHIPVVIEPAVAYSMQGFGDYKDCGVAEIHPICDEVHEFIADNNADAPHQQDMLQAGEGIARTLAAGTHGAAPHLTKTVINLGTRYIVRRLTPTECARLQGFADRWGDIDPKDDFTDEEYRFWLDVRNTHATVIGGKETKEYTKQQMLTWYSKLHSDGAEYKMWGNGIALPPALYCMQGIRDALDGAVEVEQVEREEPVAKPVEESAAKPARRVTVWKVNHAAVKKLKLHRDELTRQQYKTLKGQILAGDIDGAMAGLDKLIAQAGGATG